MILARKYVARSGMTSSPNGPREIACRAVNLSIRRNLSLDKEIISSIKLEDIFLFVPLPLRLEKRNPVRLASGSDNICRQAESFSSIKWRIKSLTRIEDVGSTSDGIVPTPPVFPELEIDWDLIRPLLFLSFPRITADWF